MPAVPGLITRVELTGSHVFFLFVISAWADLGHGKRFSGGGWEKPRKNIPCIFFSFLFYTAYTPTSLPTYSPTHYLLT